MDVDAISPNLGKKIHMAKKKASQKDVTTVISRMSGSKRKLPKNPVCSSGNSANLGSIIPNKILVPIDGNIYWHVVEPLSSDMDKFKIIYIFSRAFDFWQPYFSPIKFVATSNKSLAQIKITFAVNGDSVLPQPFDDGVLAYAYAPNGTSLDFTSDVFINDRYNWSDALSADNILLFNVIVHELLHSLGAGHSSITSDIMYPYYQPSKEVSASLDTQKWIYNNYKQYGVKNPNTVQNDEPKVLSLKDLFQSKSDLSRLTDRQINIIGSFVGANLLNTDKFAQKVTKVYNKIYV